MRASRLFLALPALLAPGLQSRSGAQETPLPHPSFQAPYVQEAYTLDDLLRIGRERNPDLLSLRAERDAAEAGRRDAGRFQNPELEYEAGDGVLFDSSEPRSVRQFNLRQTIENPLARHYRMGALQYEVEAAAEQVRFGTVELDCEVRLHYYRILFLGERLRLARLSEETLAEVGGLIESRALAGEVRELEAIRLRVEHMRAMNSVQEAELELAQYRQHLNMFLGNVLPAGYGLVGELTADLEVPEFERLQEELLPRHPLLQKAVRRREAAGQQVKVSQVGWFPDPVLSATSGRELDGDVFKLGIGFQIPLWNFSRAAVERDRQTLSQYEHQEEGLRLELQAELMIHHNHLLLHRRTLQLFREGLLQEAEASMEIAESSYREGEVSFVEYLDALRTYQSIQIEFQQALYDWNRELAELDRAAGGGIL
jgi:cobalt-zinc-cadmium efflux system outer membrane protein